MCVCVCLGSVKVGVHTHLHRPVQVLLRHELVLVDQLVVIVEVITKVKANTRDWLHRRGHHVQRLGLPSDIDRDLVHRRAGRAVHVAIPVTVVLELVHRRRRLLFPEPQRHDDLLLLDLLVSTVLLDQPCEHRLPRLGGVEPPVLGPERGTRLHGVHERREDTTRQKAGRLCVPSAIRVRQEQDEVISCGGEGDEAGVEAVKHLQVCCVAVECGEGAGSLGGYRGRGEEEGAVLCAGGGGDAILRLLGGGGVEVGREVEVGGVVYCHYRGRHFVCGFAFWLKLAGREEIGSEMSALVFLGGWCEKKSQIIGRR